MQTDTEYISSTLTNGLQLVAVPDAKLHYFVVAAFVAMGPRFEPLEVTGVSHFIEHMLFQGSLKHPSSKSISRAVDRITGHILAGTSSEYCHLGLVVHKKYAGDAIEILADLLQHPIFDGDEIEHEKKIVLEERAQFHDQRQRNLSVDELMYNLLTRADDQDMSIVGTAGNILGFNRDMLVRYWRRFFTPGNMVLSVAGAFDLDQTISKLNEQFADMPAGERAESQDNHHAHSGPKLIFRRQSSPTLSLALAWPAVPFNHRDYSAYAVISELLGAGTDSRLFTTIREELGLVYDVSSSLISGSKLGWLQVDTSVRPGNYIRTLDEILKTVAGFASRPIAQDELAVCKEKLACSLEIAHDDPSETACWYARQALFLQPDQIVSLQDELTQLDALNVDHVMTVARETFTPANVHVVVVGPIGRLARLRTRRVLRSLAGR